MLDWRLAVRSLRQLCASRGNASSALRMESYMKNVGRLHGLKAPEIKRVFDDVFNEKQFALWSLDTVFEAANELFSSSYLDEKKLGILLLQKRVKDLRLADVRRLAALVDAYVFDWATCDVLGSTVLRHIVARDNDVEKLMVQWSSDSSSETPVLKGKHDPVRWRVRLACIAFVPLARHGTYNESAFNVCYNAIPYQQRFNQLGTGWLLRNLHESEPERVIRFIMKHYDSLSREGLRYAIEKMSMSHRKQLMKGENPL